MLSRKILIVDYDQSFIDFCRTRLENEGAEVQAVSTGTEALNIIENEIFDLLLVEMWPSDMDSLAILRQLQEMNVTVPVIIVSAQPDIPVNRLTPSMQLGVVNFIEKPCKAEILLESIHHALDRRTLNCKCP